MATIQSLPELRKLYKSPSERVIKKQLTYLDKHCQHFLNLAPFAVVATHDSKGNMDASPRGGEPGFAKIIDDTTIIIPDRRGNNRLDTLSNVVDTGRIGLIFMIPGIDEALRINGTARLKTDEDLLTRCLEQGKQPTLVIEITVKEAYLHCAKAMMRSHLWSPEAQVDRATMPSVAEMIRDQIDSTDPAETQDEMMVHYKNTL